jgi:hypothetical protein
MLAKFKSMLAAAAGDGAVKAPPFVIRASDLDKNFALCYPLPMDGNNNSYIVVRTSNEGYRLEGTQVFDVCENGKPFKYRFFAEKLPG